DRLGAERHAGEGCAGASATRAMCSAISRRAAPHGPREPREGHDHDGPGDPEDNETSGPDSPADGGDGADPPEHRHEEDEEGQDADDGEERGAAASRLVRRPLGDGLSAPFELRLSYRSWCGHLTAPEVLVRRWHDAKGTPGSGKDERPPEAVVSGGRSHLDAARLVAALRPTWCRRRSARDFAHSGRLAVEDRLLDLADG